MTKRICIVEGCGVNRAAQGYCRAHYNSFRRFGDPLKNGTKIGEPRRFYDDALKYEGDECLIWPYSGSGNGKRYGSIWLDGRSFIVSRLICEFVHGAPPTPEHQAAHSCGNGHLGCVTKKHLSWKTPKENQADKLIHGTHGRGEKNPRAKLSQQQVDEIRALRGELFQREIASRFGISQAAVSKIQLGDTWTSPNFGERAEYIAYHARKNEPEPVNDEMRKRLRSAGIGV